MGRIQARTVSSTGYPLEPRCLASLIGCGGLDEVVYFDEARIARLMPTLGRQLGDTKINQSINQSGTTADFQGFRPFLKNNPTTSMALAVGRPTSINYLSLHCNEITTQTGRCVRH